MTEKEKLNFSTTLPQTTKKLKNLALFAIVFLLTTYVFVELYPSSSFKSAYPEENQLVAHELKRSWMAIYDAYEKVPSADYLSFSPTSLLAMIPSTFTCDKNTYKR